METAFRGVVFFQSRCANTFTKAHTDFSVDAGGGFGPKGASDVFIGFSVEFGWRGDVSTPHITPPSPPTCAQCTLVFSCAVHLTPLGQVALRKGWSLVRSQWSPRSLTVLFVMSTSFAAGPTIRQRGDKALCVNAVGSAHDLNDPLYRSREIPDCAMPPPERSDTRFKTWLLENYSALHTQREAGVLTAPEIRLDTTSRHR